MNINAVRLQLCPRAKLQPIVHHAKFISPTCEARAPFRPSLHAPRNAVTAEAATTSSDCNLLDPVRLGGSASATVPVSDFGGSAALDTYMRLSPENYSILDPSMIQPMGGNKFKLVVPRVTLFSLWLEPTVDITVSEPSPYNPRVLLTSEACRLAGSELIHRMQLNDRFVLKFATELTWESSEESSTESFGDMSLENSPFEGKGSITGNLELEILTEVIRPFHLMPRSVLEGTCNAVLKGVISTLLPMFVRRLANDYEIWAKNGGTLGSQEEPAPALLMETATMN